MKKLLTTAFCLSCLMTGVQAAQTQNTDFLPPKPPEMGQKQKPPMPNLDEVLQLTDKQKALAKENRIKGRKEMKPIMDEIHNKREEIMDILDSDLPEAQQKEKIKAKQEEIKVLSKKANEIREANMADFEKILTKEQKKKLESMKQQMNPNGCPSCKRMQPPPPMPDAN